MRPAICAAVLLLVLGFPGCSHSKKKAALGGGCPPAASTASAGSAQISAKALGGRYAKLVVIRATEKSNGAPVRGGKVTIHANMTCPHFMPLYTKKLQETSAGTYKAGYTLVMPGQWTLYITLRDKNGDATTSALPVIVKSTG
jgi:hypothetical protein